MAERPVRMVRFPELRARFGIAWTRRHLDQLEAAGKFPRRAKFRLSRSAWVETEVVPWIEGENGRAC